ncbi:FUSC family protein [Halalkalibacter urbisdiaboli]|uniref:FUSC family protein n=1 Tax=Halalkalibacter urbisdiaboli TaxID=1960589 RepID=UPI000B438B4E|nr:aromatic acid exporter family protein [Halalkalibacter urbisdiaboli]
MKLGARIFKTGLAIILSLYLAILFNLEPPMFAALAAAFAIQPSIYRTFQTILDQVQANVIGAVLGIIFVITFGHEPFVVGLVVVLAIAIILKVKLEPTTIPLAIVTIIVIMESPSETFVEFATGRFILILVGVFAAFIVNLVFIPPRYETKLYYKIQHATESIIQWINLLIRRDADPRSLKRDIQRLEEQMVKLENLYLLYKEERNYFMKNKYAKARKVVLFRQMVLTTKKALFVLKNLERRSEELHSLPEGFEKNIEIQLDQLTKYHDRILLRYIGKVTSQPAEEMMNEINDGKIALTELFIHQYEEKAISQAQWLHILPIISQIIEYQEQLEHLDNLVDSFFNYHKDENQVKVQEIEEE